MPIGTFPRKDPSDVLDYTLNWATLLGDDTIETVDWDVPSGLTVETTSFTATSTTIWLSGGTAGERYELICTITTAGGRTLQRTVTLPVEEL